MIHGITQAAQPQEGFMRILHIVLNWLYIVAHQIGLGAVKGLNAIFPSTKFPADIVDPIGFIIVLLLFYLLANIAKSIAKWVLILSGGLLVLRIILIIFGI